MYPYPVYYPPAPGYSYAGYSVDPNQAGGQPPQGYPPQPLHPGQSQVAVSQPVYLAQQPVQVQNQRRGRDSPANQRRSPKSPVQKDKPQPEKRIMKRPDENLEKSDNEIPVAEPKVETPVIDEPERMFYRNLLIELLLSFLIQETIFDLF